MATQKEVETRLLTLEKKVKALEKQQTKVYEEPEETIEEPVLEEDTVSQAPQLPSFTFTQVITVLGVLGLIIGAVSFFFYAVANQWIGPLGQVLIGMSLGLLLFLIAFSQQEKHPSWAAILFGGSLFIEYLSVTVGVLHYGVLSTTIGLALCSFFVGLAYLLSLRFSSRTIAYFSLIGCLYTVFILNFGLLFSALFFFVVSAALVALALREAWNDLRVATFIAFIFVLTPRLFTSNVELAWTVLFALIGFFLLFHISSLLPQRLGRKISISDVFIISALPVFTISALYPLVRTITGMALEVYGFVILLFSFLYLVQAYFFEEKNLFVTLLATGIITANIALLLLFNTRGYELLATFFVIEWVLFTYLGYTQKKMVFEVFGYIFQILSALWFIAYLSYAPTFDYFTSALLLVLLLMSILAAAYFVREKHNVVWFGLLACFGGFYFLYALNNYLSLFISSKPFLAILLSLTWLVYSLLLYAKAPLARTISFILLGITLLKIAFVDLLFLDGAFRIIGFMVFGALLIAGGYLLKNVKE